MKLLVQRKSLINAPMCAESSALRNAIGAALEKEITGEHEKTRMGIELLTMLIQMENF